MPKYGTNEGDGFVNGTFKGYGRQSTGKKSGQVSKKRKIEVVSDPSSTFSFKCVNGGSSNPSMEYAKSPLTRDQMENLIHYLCGHLEFDLESMESIKSDVKKIAEIVFQQLRILRPDVSEKMGEFPDKLGKSAFESFAMDLEKMVGLLEVFVPLYKENNEGLISKLIEHYTSHPEFQTITLFHLVMVVAQDVTTIVYHEFVLAQVEHQRAIANTISVQPTEKFLLIQESDGDVPKGYNSFMSDVPEHRDNRTAIFMQDGGGSLYEGQTRMTETAKKQVDSKCGEGAFVAVKGNRLTVVIADGVVVASAHFSAPSSKLPDGTKSPFPKKQCEILLEVISFYFEYLKEKFPGHEVIFGADWNIPKVEDTINLAKAAAKRGIYIGNDTQSETGFSLTECRPLGRSSIASLQRLKWDLLVHAAKMAFAMSMSSSERVKLSVQEGVEEGTPGMKISGDHATISMNF
jgi:hypothetical protein